MIRHVNVAVEGRVQGVGFRWATRSQARLAGVTGFVRNEEDGSVCIEAEGPSEAIERFLAWCRHGPPSAQVDQLRVEDGPVRGFSEFQIGF